MGSMSIWHWLVVAVIAMVLFGGRGKISELMGDVAKGIKSFKKGLQEEDTATAAKSDETTKPIEHQAANDLKSAATATTGAQKAG